MSGKITKATPHGDVELRGSEAAIAYAMKAISASCGSPVRDLQAKMMAKDAARLIFDRRGNHSEAHLSERELSTIVEGSILAFIERVQS